MNYDKRDYLLAKKQLESFSFRELPSPTPDTNPIVVIGDNITSTDGPLTRHSRKIEAFIRNKPFLKKTLNIFRIKHQIYRIKERESHSKNILAFTKHEHPNVSIVIPVYNKYELTLQCLESIRRFVSKKYSYEVIVFDNASTDKTKELASTPGLTYVRSEANLGFVDACNQGVEVSKGEYIIFLNNDAIITSNWLERLYETITENEDIGLVGSKILYPNGTLQEAGGIIFKDASGTNYGKGDNPGLPQYNYLRDTDYCSGASIIIKNTLFHKLGGFDRRYAPAYYEDTDLAFTVRKYGLRVVYQPQSVVYHIEGATAGTDLASGFKRYQAINKVKFAEKWKETLTQHNTKDDLFYAKDRRYSRRILIIDERIPTPDKDSGSVRMVHIIESLIEKGYKVTFQSNKEVLSKKYLYNLQQLGVETLLAPTQFLSYAKKYGKYYDAVIISRPRIGAMYIDTCQAYFENASIIYDTVDLHFLRLQRQSEYETGDIKNTTLELAEKYEIIEKSLINQADYTLVVSDIENKLLSKEGFKNIRTVSNIHEIKGEMYAIPFSNRCDLLFVGGYGHQPNIDAITWFVNDIFPLVQKQLPDIKIRVVGSNMPEQLHNFLSGKPGVIIDGFVEDLDPLLASTRVFVAPLRYGAGVKGKVGQAIENGIPVVSTSIGAEGMHLKSNVSFLEANTAKKFASQIISLYSDKTLWTRIQRNARHSIQSYFGTKLAIKTLTSLIDEKK